MSVLGVHLLTHIRNPGKELTAPLHVLLKPFRIFEDSTLQTFSSIEALWVRTAHVRGPFWSAFTIKCSAC